MAIGFCPVQKDWILVDFPKKGKDPRWGSQEDYIFATAYLSAKQWFSESRSFQIAEAIVYKQLMPGLVYDSKLEFDIQCLYKKN